MASAAANCDLSTISLSVGSCNLSLADQTVYSWGIIVAVNETQLCSSPSTVASTFLLEHENICSDEQRGTMLPAECKSRRGNYLTSSGVSLASAADTNSLAAQNPNWVELMGNLTTFQLATESPLQLQADISVSMISGFITQGINHTNSHFSLNDNSAILKELQGSNQIPAKSFGLDSGSSSYLSPRRGRLTLGGYEPEKVLGSFIEYSMNSYSKELNDHYCPLQVNVSQLDVNIGGRSTRLIYRDQPVRSCIEPYDRLFRFPTVMLKDLRDFVTNTTGWTEELKNDDGRYGGLLDLEPGLIYPVAPNGSSIQMTMDITLDGGLNFIIPTEELLAPLRGLNTNGAPVTNNSFKEIAVYREPPIGYAPVLGRALLSQLYLFVDYDQAVFKLGVLSKDDISENAVSSGTCTNGERLSATNIGLIILGIVVFLLLCSLLFLYRWWWKGRQPSKGPVGPIPLVPVSGHTSSSSSPEPITAQQIPPILSPTGQPTLVV